MLSAVEVNCGKGPIVLVAAIVGFVNVWLWSAAGFSELRGSSSYTGTLIGLA
jgi:hypothetical protein